MNAKIIDLRTDLDAVQSVIDAAERAVLSCAPRPGDIEYRWWKPLADALRAMRAEEALPDAAECTRTRSEGTPLWVGTEEKSA